MSFKHMIAGNQVYGYDEAPKNKWGKKKTNKCMLNSELYYKCRLLRSQVHGKSHKRQIK